MAFIPVYYTDTLLQAYTDNFGAVTRLAPLSASADNYDLTLATLSAQNGETVRVFEISSTAAVNITGFVAPTVNTGKPYFVKNIGTQTITLVSASGSSISANRLNATPSGNYSLIAGGYAVIIYDAGVSQWVVGFQVSGNGFKIKVPGATEGAIVMLDLAWWSVHNTGYFDSTGTKTANAVDVYYRPGNTVPTQTYAGGTAAECASQPIEATRDELIQTNRNNPSIYFISSQANGVCCRFRKNEQGYGLNKRGA